MQNNKDVKNNYTAKQLCFIKKMMTEKKIDMIKNIFSKVRIYFDN